MDYRRQISQNFRTDTKRNLSAIVKVAAKGIMTTILLTTIAGLPAKAQTNITESDYLENIEADDSQWDFSGTSESVSVEDEISNLEEFDISEFDSRDLRLDEESRRRNSRRGIKDYSIETEVYDY